METQGQKLRRYLAQAGMSQKELAERLGLEPSYVSRMVNDRIGWIHSRYFGQIASILRVDSSEIRELNPAAVITVAPSVTQRGPIPPVIGIRETPISIPPELLAMIEEHAERYPELLSPQIQRMLAAPRAHGGAEVGPKTKDDWLEYFLLNRRWLL